LRISQSAAAQAPARQTHEDGGTGKWNWWNESIGVTTSIGHLPAWCVGVGATRERTFPGGTFGLPCVLVITKLTPGERHDKAKLNDILRDHGVATS
jgi:hypothetical protein